MRERLPNLEVIHISLGYWAATPGYADFNVPTKTPLVDLYEPVLTDEDTATQLKSQFTAEEMTVIPHPRWKEVGVPK